MSVQTFGNGAIAQAILSRDRGVEFVNGTNGTAFFNPPLGTEMSINLGYGVGVMIGAYIAIGVTGGHMNPAVTLAMAIRGKTCWLKVRGRKGGVFLRLSFHFTGDTLLDCPISGCLFLFCCRIWDLHRYSHSYYYCSTYSCFCIIILLFL